MYMYSHVPILALMIQLECTCTYMYMYTYMYTCTCTVCVHLLSMYILNVVNLYDCKAKDLVLYFIIYCVYFYYLYFHCLYFEHFGSFWIIFCFKVSQFLCDRLSSSFSGDGQTNTLICLYFRG